VDLPVAPSHNEWSLLRNQMNQVVDFLCSGRAMPRGQMAEAQDHSWECCRPVRQSLQTVD
jgi:hypothetical protein